jgi:serine/threonine-protein kinase ATR
MILFLGFHAAAAEQAQPAPAALPHRQHPTMAEFMGLNVHTVQFKASLYAPVCQRLRDYHPLRWDFGEDTAAPTKFPMTVNGVDWNELYGSWTKAGFDVDACIMFDDLPPGKWRDSARDARAYGEAFARYFGPSAAGHSLASSIEIGNEPAKYSEAQYRTLFEAMARGVRAGDPKLKIATCAVMTGKPDQWSKPLSAIAGLESLYDVLNIHSYAFKDKWPTWRRSYPEDPSIPFLKEIDGVVHWRDEHAPGKELWLTEFGYDSATKPPAADGPWKDWVGVTDEQQARYIVRSFLVLSSMELDRAYLYFFNDQDEAQLHGASGITRNFKPKPSFYAMAHLYRSLGDYRFVRVVPWEGPERELYCFEYERLDHPGDRVHVAWLPTSESKSILVLLSLPPGSEGVYRVERMATSAVPPEKVKYLSGRTAKSIAVEVEVTETPVFLWSR